MRNGKFEGGGHESHGHGQRRGSRHAHRSGHRHARGRLFGPGEMRLAMLDLLKDGPAHGYELMQRLSEKTEGRYEPSAGATYPVLQQIVDEDLASVKADAGKKVYRLTDNGFAAVADNAGALSDIWQRAATWRRWSRLDSAEYADIGELRALVEAVMERLRDAGNDTDVKSKLKTILAEAVDRVGKT